jgi:fumarylpyruvate hydrolase
MNENRSAEALFSVPAAPLVAVSSTKKAFPVNRIFCIGRNYAEHAKEMGVEVDREAPFFFLKHAGAIVASGATIPYPPGTSNYHYEMELVVAIGAPAWRVSTDGAMDAVFGYACGLDMTRRDLQLDARSKGRPWDIGKDFEQSAIIGAIVPKNEFGPVAQQRIALAVNGIVKQDAKLSDLVWSVEELISFLSTHYHLAPGDLIYTGTPAGVGAVVPGDQITGEIDGLPHISLTIAAAQAQ